MSQQLGLVIFFFNALQGYFSEAKASIQPKNQLLRNPEPEFLDEPAHCTKNGAESSAPFCLNRNKSIGSG